MNANRLAAASLLLLVIPTGCGSKPMAVAAAAATLPDPVAGPLPEIGTYRLRWIQDHVHPVTADVPGIRMGAGLLPRRAWVQVDYQGQKTRAELVVRNTVDGEAGEPIVIYDEPFGAADLEIRGNNARYFDGEPLSRPQQTFVIDVFALSGDRPNAFASIMTFDSERRDFHRAEKAEFYAAPWDSSYRDTSSRFGDGMPEWNKVPGPSEFSDNDTTSLFYFGNKRTLTEIQLRFR